MSPQKQAAQIANAQKSHGATTEAGRARSSQNSIRHSLCSKKYYIVPEDRPEFDLYYNDLISALAPEGALESVLAEKIILDEWRLTRARQVEDQIFCNGYMSAQNQFAAGAETWLAHSQELATLTLYEQRINRVLTRNKVEFESKQLTRRGAVLRACDTPAPHPDEFSTMETHLAEPPQASVQPAFPVDLGSKTLATEVLETAGPEPPVGFVHSSKVDSAAADLQPPTPTVTPAETDPEQPGGFVHSISISPAPVAKQTETAGPDVSGFVRSSAAASGTSDPQPAAQAVKRHAGGFVRSSGCVTADDDPFGQPAGLQPASIPSTPAQRAA